MEDRISEADLDEPQAVQGDNRAVQIIGYMPDMEPLFHSPKPDLSERLLVNGKRVAESELTSPPATPLLTVLRQASVNACSDYFREGSVRGSVFNLCSATLGAGALSLPYAFAQSGALLGLILLAVGAAATVFSINLLIEARTLTGNHSYEDLTVDLYGNTMGIIVELNIVVFCFGTAIAYIVAVGDILEPVLVITSAPAWLTRDVAMALFWALIMFPLSSFEKVNSLRFSSFFGVLSIFYLVIAAVYHSIKHLSDAGWHDSWGEAALSSASLQDIMQAMPIVIFAFTCQVNVFSIYDELESASAKRMGTVTNGAIGICMTVYSLMGIFGYLDFGKATQGNILQNYCIKQHQDPVIILAFVAITLTIVMAFPLVVFPCRYAVDQMLFRKHQPSKLRHGSLTLVISGAALLIALVVPDINVVFQLMGGTTSAFVCFVLPAAFAIKLQLAKTAIKRIAVWSLAIGGTVVGALSTALTVYAQFIEEQPSVKVCN